MEETAGIYSVLSQRLILYRLISRFTTTSLTMVRTTRSPIVVMSTSTITMQHQLIYQGRGLRHETLDISKQ